MGQVWVDFEQEFSIDLNDKQIKDFLEKHKDIVYLFGDNFLKKDDKGNITLLGEMSFSIDSQDIPRSCTVVDGEINLSLARARFFSTTESSNAAFSWGSTEGFGEKFYRDLEQLISGGKSINGFHASATVSGDNGYSEGTYDWGEKGLIEDLQYYEYEEDEYEDW